MDSLTENQTTYSTVSPCTKDICEEVSSYVLRVVLFSNELCKRLSAEKSVYYPTYISKKNINGKVVAQTRPKIPGYAFVSATEEEAKRIAADIDGVYLAFNKNEILGNGVKTYMKVSADEMKRLRSIIDCVDGETQLFDPRDIDLSEGDRIRIVGGRFDGREGILISQQGKDGGTVFLEIADCLMARQMEISPEYIKIISFAKKGKHQYEKLRAIRRRINAVMDNYTSGRDIPAKDTSALNYFLNRYGDVEVSTTKQIIDYRLTCLTVYMLLQQDETQKAQQLFESLCSMEEDLTKQKQIAVRNVEVQSKQRHIDFLRAGLDIISKAKAQRKVALAGFRS